MIGLTPDDIDARAVASMAAVAMGASWLAGRWLGRRLREKSEGQAAASKFEDASLAIVGLLLGFTFSMALSKHDYRRVMVVAESSAIGDFYTCASLLKGPVRTKLRSLIHDYTALRVDLAKHPYDEARFERALRQFQQMHHQMAELVSEAIDNGTPIAGSLANSLNAVTDNHAARIAAITDSLPTAIIALLLLSAVVAALLVGREQGTTGKSDIAGTLCFILVFSFALFVTLDLNRPDRGLITVSQEPMQRLLSTMSE